MAALLPHTTLDLARRWEFEKHGKATHPLTVTIPNRAYTIPHRTLFVVGEHLFP
ncbi:hypothetical protein ACPOL_2959 [Acidisarcina polymorpha]|uniref:Uncharacterized protein n=1 Tax=Acidisarcina polymorpha TaxID=2211140 RepID=A0A2Z5FZF6_9BACT|nr:hypothetical protein ACPOL_2959 [Acidisarcina polymorpha]